jgi:O-acetyl-ADP-ribose deacetylase (regulator of RNase III)
MMEMPASGEAPVALDVVCGDITALAVDAIVNAANETLLGGGGVDGAIHRAAGPELQAFCRALGGCPTGEAKLTPGFLLPARHVIHVVGPVWQGGGAGESTLLASCYRHALRLARGAGCASVAFPCVSTGAYGYPTDLAAPLVVETVRGTLREMMAQCHASCIERVVFCCFSAADAAHYRACLTA